MKVEIWSDVMCPFCYIGKRKFEKALERFSGKDQVEIEWKSFQLNPNMKTAPGKSINQYLSEVKGWSLQRAEQVNANVTNLAKEVGLTYRFDKAIVANSLDAHRLSHLAKKYGLQDKAEEQLFSAYFTDGKNTADHQTLLQIGKDIGLPSDEVESMLGTDLYIDEVNSDVHEAEMLGVTGVPFFVFDRHYAISGAQAPEDFLEVLNKAFHEEKKFKLISEERPAENSCTADGGSCD